MNRISRPFRYGLFLVCLAGWVCLPVHAGKELEKGEFTVVKNKIEHAKGDQKAPAKVSEKLEENSEVDSGTASFTEMKFEEGSVMRLGANTRFTFQSKERMIQLKEGSLLIHTPPGNGGVSVNAGGVVGAVSGSTVMASRDAQGNFCFVVLESAGPGQVTADSGIQANLTSGQVAFYEKSKNSIRVFELNLDAVIDYSPLFTQFDRPMAGMEKIQSTADAQSIEVLNETKFLVGPKDLGVPPEDPAHDVLALIFEKIRDEIVTSKNTFLADLSTAAGQEIAKGQEDSGNLLLPPGSLADARQEGGAAIAEASNPPGAGPLPNTDTAAGGEDPGGTDTAAGGGGGPDTQAPTAPVGGGTIVNPPSATETGRTG